MITTRQVKLQNMQAHVSAALGDQLHEGEVIEAMAAQGQMWLTHIYEIFRFLRLQPPSFLVITNQRVLLATLPGKLPTRDISQVKTGSIVEQRPRRAGETFDLATSARDLHEPGRTIGMKAIKVEQWVFTPSMGWQFV